MIGKSVNGFTLQRKLGEGGMNYGGFCGYLHRYE